MVRAVWEDRIGVWQRPSFIKVCRQTDRQTDRCQIERGERVSEGERETKRQTDRQTMASFIGLVRLEGILVSVVHSHAGIPGGCGVQIDCAFLSVAVDTHDRHIGSMSVCLTYIASFVHRGWSPFSPIAQIIAAPHAVEPLPAT